MVFKNNGYDVTVVPPMCYNGDGDGNRGTGLTHGAGGLTVVRVLEPQLRAGLVGGCFDIQRREEKVDL
jgi:hypothetical protein